MSGESIRPEHEPPRDNVRTAADSNLSIGGLAGSNAQSGTDPATARAHDARQPKSKESLLPLPLILSGLLDDKLTPEELKFHAHGGASQEGEGSVPDPALRAGDQPPPSDDPQGLAHPMHGRAPSAAPSGPLHSDPATRRHPRHHTHAQHSPPTAASEISSAAPLDDAKQSVNVSQPNGSNEAFDAPAPEIGLNALPSDEGFDEQSNPPHDVVDGATTFLPPPAASETPTPDPEAPLPLGLIPLPSLGGAPGRGPSQIPNPIFRGPYHPPANGEDPRGIELYVAPQATTDSSSDVSIESRASLTSEPAASVEPEADSPSPSQLRPHDPPSDHGYLQSIFDSIVGPNVTEPWASSPALDAASHGQNQPRVDASTPHATGFSPMLAFEFAETDAELLRAVRNVPEQVEANVNQRISEEIESHAMRQAAQRSRAFL